MYTTSQLWINSFEYLILFVGYPEQTKIKAFLTLPSVVMVVLLY